MQLIVYGGDAKSSAIEAVNFAKKFDFEKANSKLEDANESMLKAHQTQTQLLQKEAQGETLQLSLLMVHGQDHLMNAITYIDIAKEIVHLYEFIHNSTLSMKNK